MIVTYPKLYQIEFRFKLYNRKLLHYTAHKYFFINIFCAHKYWVNWKQIWDRLMTSVFHVVPIHELHGHRYWGSSSRILRPIRTSSTEKCRFQEALLTTWRQLKIEGLLLADPPTDKSSNTCNQRMLRSVSVVCYHGSRSIITILLRWQMHMERAAILVTWVL
jgi:hypothetical protein